MAKDCDHGILVFNGDCNGKVVAIKSSSNNNRNSNDMNASHDDASIDVCGIHSVLVVLASATINGIIFGVVNSFGVLYFFLTEMFKNNDTKKEFTEPLIAGVGSLSAGLIFFCSIFASLLTDRYGVRRVCFFGGLLATIGMYASSLSTQLLHLYITYGVILGIGGSLAYAPSLVILGHYFKKRLGLANGLVTAGSALFTVIMPLILKRLIDSSGIQTTLGLLSALMSLLMICAITFKENLPGRTNAGSKSVDNKKLLNGSLWNNKLYLLWVIAIPIALFGYFVPFVHLVKHAKVVAPQHQGEWLVTCIGAFSGVGRFVTGPIADFSNVNRIVLQQIAFVSIGLLTILITVSNDFYFLLVICCGLGIFDGCFITLLGPIAFDLVGPDDASQAIGWLLCFCSLPLTIGPPIAAYLFDLYNSYTLAFILAGIPPIFGALLMMRILNLQRKLRQRPYYSVKENGVKPSIFATETNHDSNHHHSSLVKVSDEKV